MTGSRKRYAKKALNHSLREPMIEEMHARPFLKLKAPCRLAFIALKPEAEDTHSPEAARRQLFALLDQFGAEHPEDGAVFHVVEVGDMTLKWENHSEFATYTLFTHTPKPDNLGTHSFATDLHAHFTLDWLEAHPGRIISSVSVRIEQARTQKVLEALMTSVVPNWFGSPTTSFAAAYVIDRSAAIAADFDLDHNGQIRLAMLACDTIGPGRIGRVVQRFLEIETYRAMSMLTLPLARKVMKDLKRINAELSATVEEMGDADETDKQALNKLLRISAELSLMSSRSSFRFSAASAYENIVLNRIELLREERILGRQLVSEFMKRRYAPSMRTCDSANMLLEDLTERAADAVELLGTRVSVTTAEQNRQLLSKMDARAAQQARLQETVEGISVVAIAYYAVSLLSYLLAPLTKVLPISKTMISALLVIPVAAFVWMSMHRLKERLIRKPDIEGREDH